MPILAILAQRLDFACRRSEQAHLAYKRSFRFHAYGQVDRAFLDQAFHAYDRARSAAMITNRKLLAAALR